MIKKTTLKSRPVTKVKFEIPANLEAASAYLVGDFNNWSKTATPMKKLKDGRLTVTLDLEQAREYQFRYLLNGHEWQNDSQADGYVRNPFGEQNSVVRT